MIWDAELMAVLTSIKSTLWSLSVQSLYLRSCMLLFVPLSSPARPDPIQCKECAFNSGLERTYPKNRV